MTDPVRPADTLTIGGPKPARRSSMGPLATGAWWGVLAGAAVGTATALIILNPGDVVAMSDGFEAEDIPGLLLIVAFAGFVGLCYGALVGWIAGFGAILAPKPNVIRRLVVTGLVLLTGFLTCLTVITVWQDDGYRVLTIFLPVMALIAWLLAPRLPTW